MKRLFARIWSGLKPRAPLQRSRVEVAVAGVCIAFLLWLGVIFSPEFWGIQDEPYRWWRWLKGLPVDLGMTGLFALGLVLLFAVPRLWQFMRRWAAWRKPIFLDVVLGSFTVFQIVTALWSDPSTSRRALIWAGVSTSILLPRLAFHRRRPQPAPPSLFDQTLGTSGFAPLPDFSEDQLERGPLLESLCQLVAYKRKVSVNFGLEGAWGSGKTTLLRALEQGLTAAGHIVVRFDAWSYREPDRLVRSYFDALESALSKTIAVPGLRRRLYKLASGLAEIGEGRLVTIAGGFLRGLSGVSEEDLRQEVGRTLEEIDRSVVVLVDDLDRLDGDELRAVLRAIRLVGELPNLTHVLAYDREQISKTLFPEDFKGTRARDYLGKLIHVELSIGVPPVDLATRLLDSGLQPLLQRIGDAAAKLFVADLQREPLSKLLEVLPTPREIRRVAAATAWHWEQMERRVNPFDVFILSAVQYRFPSLYATMRSHPEWFTVAEWSANPWRLAYKEEWEKESESFFRELSKREDLESRMELHLLRLLLPSIAGTGIESPRSSEEDAKRSRRLLHPDNYHRYFSLYIPASVITEAEVEDFAASVLAAAPGAARQAMVRDRIVEEIQRGRIESFWDQWNIGFSHRSPLEISFAEDLAAGISLASDRLSSDWGFFRNSELDRSIGAIAHIVSLAQSDEEATRVLASVVRSSAVDYVPGKLIKLTRDKKEDPGIFGKRSPDIEVLEAALNARISQRYQEVGSLLAAPRLERVAVLWSTDLEQIEALFKRDLLDRPVSLPRLLEIACPINSDQKLVVERFDLTDLASILPMEELRNLTASLPLESWKDPVERELVSRFRAWDPRAPRSRGDRIEEGFLEGEEEA